MTSERARALHRKYETLLELRRAAGSTPPDKGVLRSLVSEFPGCLRELDARPLEELEELSNEASVASQGGFVTRRMLAIAAYHDALRGLTGTKLRPRPREQRHRSALVDEAIEQVSTTLGLEEALVERLVLGKARRPK